MQALQIKNFKGMVNQDEGLGTEMYSKYTVGLDVFGLNDNVQNTFPSRPGVLQGAKKTTAMTEAAATDDVTDLILHFAKYSGSGTGSGDVYGLSGGATPRAYRNVSGTWTFQSTFTLTSAAGGGGIADFAGKVYFLQNSRGSSWDGTTYTAAAFSYTNNNSTPRPAKVYAGFLYMGNGVTLCKWDGTTLTDIFSLPTGFTIRSLEVYGDVLVFTADNGQFSRIFLYRNGSATFESFYDIPSESTGPKVFQSQGILWLFGSSSSGINIYTFNGSSLEKIFQLPSGSLPLLSASYVAEYLGQVVFGITDTSGADFEDGMGGVWMIGRAGPNYPWTLSLLFPTDGLGDSILGGVYGSSSTILIASEKLSTVAFSVYTLDTNGDCYDGGVWQSMPLDMGDPVHEKMIHGIRIEADSNLSTARDVVVKYRTNHPTGVSPSFTTLRTINSTTYRGKFIPLNISARAIEIRVELGADSTGSADFTTRLYAVTVFYTPTLK